MAETITPALIQPRCHIVLDLETLGTGHDAQIFQIGAVAIINGKKISRFFQLIQLDGEIKVDAETLKWWLSDPKRFHDELFKCKPVYLDQALERFNSFLGGFDDYVLVGNGATFDITILESAYKKEGIPFRCDYRRYRDLRTYKELYERTTNCCAERLMNGHSALEDAENEADFLIQILEFFRPMDRPQQLRPIVTITNI